MREEKLGLSVPLLNANEDRVETVARGVVVTVTSPVTAKPMPAWLTLTMLDHNRTSESSLRIFVVNGRFISLWRVSE